jgi:hypothetical protein
MHSAKPKALCGWLTAFLILVVPAVGEAQKDIQKELQKLKKRVAP